MPTGFLVLLATAASVTVGATAAALPDAATRPVPAAEAIPPLTPEEREQLHTGADDRAPRSQDAGLYPLLRNALRWPAGRQGDARPADYQALLQEPAAHRGQLMVVEGLLARAPAAAPQLDQPGPWDGRLEMWHIKYSDREEDVDSVARLYLVSPPSPPEPGARVRVLVRFYRVWRQAGEMNNKVVPYLLFVGAGAEVTAPPPSRAKLPGAGATMGLPLMVVMGMVLLAGFAYFMMRRRLAGRARPERALPSRLQARQEGAQGEAEDPDAEDLDEEGPPLPRDPAEALAELERRRAAK